MPIDPYYINYMQCTISKSSTVSWSIVIFNPTNGTTMETEVDTFDEMLCIYFLLINSFNDVCVTSFDINYTI